MSTICSTCCSRNIKLSAITLEHWNVLKQLLSSCECIKDYVWSESLKICKECTEMLKNILLFRNKVVKSISVLEDKLINSSAEKQWRCKSENDDFSAHSTSDVPQVVKITVENIFISDDIKVEEEKNCNKLENVADCDLTTDIKIEDESTDTCDGKYTDSEQQNAEGKDNCNSVTENELENVADCDFTIDLKIEDESSYTFDGKNTDSEQQNAEEKDNCNSVTENEQGSGASQLNVRPKGRHLTWIEKNIAVNLYKRLLSSLYKEEAARKTAEIMGMSKTTIYRALKGKHKKSCEAPPRWFMRVLSDDGILEEIDEARARPEFMSASHKCVTCAIVFKDDIELTEHNNAYHNNGYGFLCRFCSRAFVSDDDLRGHLSRHRERYTCTQCLRETDSEKVVHELHDHQCTYDEKAFNQCIIKNIITKKLFNESKQYRCELCSKEFYHKSIMDRHMDIIHGDVKEGKEIVSPEMGQFFYCKTCDVHFEKEYSYKQHMKTTLKHMNQDILKHRCRYCERRFMSPCHLRIHVNGVHLKENGYKCDQCPKSYGTKSNLKVHIALKHENKTKERKYICEVCASAFWTNPTLKAHMRRHTGERPYKCKVCAATFSYSGALYTHNKLVHERVKITGTKTKKKQKTE